MWHGDPSLVTRQPAKRRGDETGTSDAAQPPLKVDGTTDILSARVKSCLPGQASTMLTPFAMQDQHTQRTSPANDQCVRLDAELLR
ncbi:hypothetical protein GCM10009859_08510 [Kocuria salsicia]